MNWTEQQIILKRTLDIWCQGHPYTVLLPTLCWRTWPKISLKQNKRLGTDHTQSKLFIGAPPATATLEIVSKWNGIKYLMQYLAQVIWICEFSSNFDIYFSFGIRSWPYRGIRSCINVPLCFWHKSRQGWWPQLSSNTECWGSPWPPTVEATLTMSSNSFQSWSNSSRFFHHTSLFNLLVSIWKCH